MDTERNMLAALTAVRQDWIRLDDLARLWQAWLDQGSADFACFLVDRGVLLNTERVHLDALVEHRLDRYGGNIKEGLASLCPGLATTVVNQILAQPATFVQSIAPMMLPPVVAPTPKPPAPKATPDASTAFERLFLHAAGGIGQVWRARDRRLGREVALKELKPELAHDPELARRFLAEAEVTGQLEHPGIVPIYELPSRTGNPFYVMRFVKGQTLTEKIKSFHEHAGKGQTLERAGLLNIFAAVCQTVAFAHDRGVLHRDLKGQNILVGDYGEVILLDWGLAKRLHDDAEKPVDVAAESRATFEETLPGQVMGTPYFMSPEQADGAKLDPRADIYSLGAILYEMLTGRPPYADQVEGSAGSSAPTVKLQDLLQLIRTGAPTRPRRLVRDVPASLEAVCLKALSRRPEDRYATATDLAREIQRWLADEPVEAFPDPWWVRLGRWSRKHKASVAALGVLVLAGIVGLIVTNVMVGREKVQTELALARAEKNFRKAQEAVDRYFTQISEERLLNEPGLQPLRKELLATAKEFYQDLVKEKNTDLSSRQALAQGLVKLGRIAGQLGEREEALRSYGQAHELFARLRLESPANDAFPLGQGQSAMGLGYQKFLVEGAAAEVEALLKEAVATLQDLERRNPNDQHRGELAHAHNTAAFFYEDIPLQAKDRKARLERAEYHRLEAVRLWQQLADEQPGDDSRLNDLGNGLLNLTVFYNIKGALKLRDETALRTLELRQKLADEHAKKFQYQANLAAAHNNYGVILRNDKNYAAAKIHLDKTIAIFEKMVRQNPTIVQYQHELANGYLNLGNLFYFTLPASGERDRDKSFTQAKATYERARGIWEKLTLDYSGERRFAVSFGIILSLMGDLVLEEDKQEAVRIYDEAIRQLAQQRGKGEREKDVTRHLCNAYWGRAQARTDVKEYAAALKDWNQALVLYEGDDRVSLHIGLARTLMLSRDYVGAAKESVRAADQPVRPIQQLQLAQILALCLGGAGKDASATLWADKAVNLLARAHAGGIFKTHDAADILPLFQSRPIIAQRADFQKLVVSIMSAK